MTDAGKFRNWVRWMRKNFRGEYPVRVYMVPRAQIKEGELGETFLRQSVTGPERMLVRVSEAENEDLTIDTLIEEWAHYLRFHLPKFGDPENHDPIYGAIFNEIKSKWYDESR